MERESIEHVVRTPNGSQADVTGHRRGSDSSEQPEQSQDPKVARGNQESPSRAASEAIGPHGSTTEPDRERSGIPINGSDLDRLAASASRQSRVLLATVVSQTLKELDRDL